MDVKQICERINEKAAWANRLKPQPIEVVNMLRKWFKISIPRACKGFLLVLYTGKLKGYTWDARQMRWIRNMAQNENIRELYARLDLDDSHSRIRNLEDP